jgi:hypothetical protein
MTRKTAAIAATVAALALLPLAIRYGRQVADEAHQVYLSLMQDDRMRRSARLLAEHREAQSGAA